MNVGQLRGILRDWPPQTPVAVRTLEKGEICLTVDLTSAALHALPAKSCAHLSLVVREALDDEEADEWLADMIQDELGVGLDPITNERQAQLRAEGLLP